VITLIFDVAIGSFWAWWALNLDINWPLRISAALSGPSLALMSTSHPAVGLAGIAGAFLLFLLGVRLDR
jgi:hypothetical protein